MLLFVSCHGWKTGITLRVAACGGAVTATFAAELRSEGFSLAALDPGWCRTDMGTGTAIQIGSGMLPPIEPRDSVKGMIKVMAGLEPENSGTFVSWEGITVPW
jgi:hypothetical protein